MILNSYGVLFHAAVVSGLISFCLNMLCLTTHHHIATKQRKYESNLVKGAFSTSLFFLSIYKIVWVSFVGSWTFFIFFFLLIHLRYKYVKELECIERGRPEQFSHNICFFHTADNCLFWESSLRDFLFPIFCLILDSSVHFVNHNIILIFRRYTYYCFVHPIIPSFGFWYFGHLIFFPFFSVLSIYLPCKM